MAEVDLKNKDSIYKLHFFLFKHFFFFIKQCVSSLHHKNATLLNELLHKKSPPPPNVSIYPQMFTGFQDKSASCPLSQLPFFPFLIFSAICIYKIEIPI